MRFLQPYIDSMLEIWRDSSPAARIGIGLLAALCIVAIAGVGYWSVQPSYVVLVSSAEGDKVDRVIDALDREGIEYKLTGAGGNLLVDQRDFANARRLARSSGVSTSAAPATEGGFGNPFESPDQRRNTARILKEQRLAESIQKYQVVEHADVHLNIPNRGPFERKTSTPSASVLLTLADGSRLTQEQAHSIATFVAFAVEDLDPTGVQITDKNGNSYITPEEGAAQIGSQVEYTTAAEKRLASKAETQLLSFLGFGNASVQVSLDMTFANGSRTTTKYDPDSKVPTEEDLITESTTNLAETPQGPTGTAGNLQSRRVGSGNSNSESKTENIKTIYAVGKTEETEASSTPKRNFMTVSVLVNSGAEGVIGEDGALLPGINQKVTDIVKNAVGFRDDSDTISVEFLSFPEVQSSAAPVATPFDWRNILSIVETASLAVAALFAFLIGWLLLRRYQPPARRTSGGDTSGRSENVGQLAQLIKDNPEVFARIVKSWSGSDKADRPASKEAA